MKEINKFFIFNNKIKNIWYVIFLTLMVSIISLLLFCELKQNKNIPKYLNSSLNKTKIRNIFLKRDNQAIINSIFINTTPDKKTSIYVGGKELSDSKGNLGALVVSIDKGITWQADKYFVNPQTSTNASHPVINKIMTDFYSDSNGIADSLVVEGEYLKSIPSSNNGNSLCAGQIAYERVFYTKTGIINSLTQFAWRDIIDRDFNSSVPVPSTNEYSQKVVATSIVVHISTVNKSVQDHIYIITNDENISINETTYSKDSQNHIYKENISKFLAYDMILKNENIGLYPTENSLTKLIPFLNPSSIYGDTQKDFNKGLASVSESSTFNAEKTSFRFISGIPTHLSTHVAPVGDDKCYIAENLHFDATLQDSSQSLYKPSFDYPLIIEYEMSNPASKYLTLSKDISNLDNFLVKTIAINPITPYNDGKYDSNFLILAGEKNNASYMISLNLIGTKFTPSTFPYPSIKIDSYYNPNYDGSFITKIISFPIFNVPTTQTTSNLKTKVMPIVIFGMNMSSYNANIVLPDSDTQFIPNKQNLTGKCLLLANIHFTEDTNKATTKTSVFYSQPNQYPTITNPYSEINFVDNSKNYFTTGISSLNNDYTFSTCIYDSKYTLKSGSNLNNYRITQNANSKNNFFFSKAKTPANLIKPIVITVSVLFIILLSSLVVSFYYYRKSKTRLKLTSTSQKSYNSV